MLEVLYNFINCLITAMLGFYIIKRIIKSDKKFFSFETVIWIIIQAIVTALLQKNQYIIINPLIIYFLNIIIYKQIFKISINESLILVGIMMLVTLVGDMIVATVFSMIFSIDKIRSSWFLMFTVNILTVIVVILIFNIPSLKKKLQKFYMSARTKNKLINSIFIVLTIIASAIIVYNLYKNFHFNSNFISNLSVILILVILIMMFMSNFNKITKLTTDYDNLFKYIQNFEEWIEKEQLNRHEYKNQLAVLRTLSKDKQVKNKINEILEDNINLEGEIINQLKKLPKGGIKGLMYYKLVIAQKNKINLVVDVSIKKKSVLNNLTEKQISDLCKLIGIYFDNAIEAAKETKKKRVLIEIYELKDKVNIVFSNTFKKENNFDNRNKKGISTKGEGHGNGLYFANKVISKNKWLEEKQKIIDDYYIEQVSIIKLEI